MRVPEIPSLIVDRLHSRRMCSVFISTFNISLLFFVLFFLFFPIRGLFLRSCGAACLPCNQPRTTTATTTDDNSFRISLPASPLLHLLPLFLLLVSFTTSAPCSSFPFSACCCMRKRKTRAREGDGERERERERERIQRV